jgi:hypothetical protein
MQSVRLVAYACADCKGVPAEEDDGRGDGGRQEQAAAPQPACRQVCATANHFHADLVEREKERRTETKL